MKRLLGFTVLVVTILLLKPFDATAADIRVLRGTYFQTINSAGHLSIDGTDGLSIDAFVPDSLAGLGWYFCENLGCQPGEVVSLRAYYTAPFEAGGQVRIHGQTYTFGATDDASAIFEFDPGSIVLPEFTDTNMVTLYVPFTFSGSLQIPNAHDPDAAADVFELEGSGVATVTLVRHLYTGDWVVSNVTYDFEPRADVTRR
jgi:hypothetical protein